MVYELGASIALSAGIAFVIGYTFRVLALYRAWEPPLAKEPTGVYVHDDGRPMLGRKLKGKSDASIDTSAWPSTRTRTWRSIRSWSSPREGLDNLIADRTPITSAARAAKTDVPGRAIGRVALPGRRPVTPAVRGVA